MMELSERRILKQVAILPAKRAVNVQWANQILRGAEVISETYDRRSYSVEDKAGFLADVEGAENYLVALGWGA